MISLVIPKFRGNMTIEASASDPAAEAVHPPAQDITELMVFRLARLVAINERAGHRWSEQMFALRLNEWRVLGLARALEPVQFREIAGRLIMDKGQLSRIVKALVERGFLDTMVARDDARSLEIHTTEAGRQLHDRVLPFTKQRNEAAVEVLTREEYLEFMRVLDKLLEHNESQLRQSEWDK
ncbi:MAG TPA: MarR family winged helix-turn-helix transcriptional regulator [Alphaproteobacteria bacterium]|jgi:DNA-binding MarR family transcriptional regulator|nr:MarR family winged helix-turn-helix transcriptional regulator [Alphaproteobacteria bacterium]HJM49494.1 MarR family winged helix-turn-helix transcriptional regulator [Alphaproteobacteria bacterium]|tara:strand:- start:516 stop:1061 length:546 start_codon:yes stop_codon:yes gene_type:complete